MIAENQVRTLEHMVTDIIEPIPGFFLVELSIRPTNNVKVFIDADQGASIDELTKINRTLYRRIEESGMFPNGDFSLEISSPGLDEPLKLLRQYLKNIGRPVEVLMKNGFKYEGKLISATDEEIVVEEERENKKEKGKGKEKGKEKERIEHKISTEEIKSTKIQIKF